MIQKFEKELKELKDCLQPKNHHLGCLPAS
jgi:hypothetical protein